MDFQSIVVHSVFTGISSFEVKIEVNRRGLLLIKVANKEPDIRANPCAFNLSIAWI
jgi:hypothetical protein